MGSLAGGGSGGRGGGPAGSDPTMRRAPHNSKIGRKASGNGHCRPCPTSHPATRWPAPAEQPMWRMHRRKRTVEQARGSHTRAARRQKHAIAEQPLPPSRADPEAKQVRVAHTAPTPRCSFEAASLAEQGHPCVSYSRRGRGHCFRDAGRTVSATSAQQQGCTRGGSHAPDQQSART